MSVISVRASTDRSRRILIALALWHIVFALWLAGEVVWLIIAGTRPSAELEGIYAGLGELLAVPILIALIQAVRGLRLAQQSVIRKARAITFALGAFELVIGVVGLVVLVSSSSTWPLAFLIPFNLGIAAMVVGWDGVR